VHAADAAAAQAVALRVRAAYRIGRRHGRARPLIAARVGREEEAR
jgi:hypothetical protein